MCYLIGKITFAALFPATKLFIAIIVNKNIFQQFIIRCVEAVLTVFVLLTEFYL